MRVCEWLRTLVAKLPRLLPRRREAEEEDEPGVLTELDKRLGKEILERQARRKVDTRHGGPNMPRSQPCPVCRRKSKRVGKIDEDHYRGAYYMCPNHDKFFVSAR
jgi:hypothetical protein